VLAEGEPGELVLTSLTKQAMPIIRFRTRDRTRLLPGTARTMRRIDRIGGRTDDMLIVRGVNLFPSQIEEQLLRGAALTGHYQIVLTRAGRMDEVTVHVEGRPDAEAAALETEARAAMARIKEVIGLTCEVRIAAPGSIERSAGKARRVLDRR
jgi:phenylacetate-CoA ligase